MNRAHPRFTHLSPIERRFVRIGQLTGPIIATGPGGRGYAHGTAFVVGDRLAITAAHVVEGYLQYLHGVNLHEDLTWQRRARRPLEMGMVLLLPGLGRKTIQLEVLNTRVLSPGDVALLELGNSQNYPWQSMDPYPQLRLVGPKLNESIFSLGYPSKGVRMVRGHQVVVNLSPTSANGQVVDTDLEPRNLSSRRVPRFQTDANYLPGMSGSPIIGEDGRICGVVASSITGDIGESPISFGSILWPLASTMIIRRAPMRHSTKMPRKLLRTGLLGVVDYDLLPSAVRDLPSVSIQGKLA